MADSKETLICPACGREMEKIFIKEHNINLDICLEGCGGIFFDNREFERFDEQHENIDDILKAIENKEFEKTDESKQRMCPVCSSIMVKNYASAKHEVQIDCCYSCGGKFLDNGELTKIRSQYPTEQERSKDFHSLLLQFSSPALEALELAEIERNEREAKRSGVKRTFDKHFETVRRKLDNKFGSKPLD